MDAGDPVADAHEVLPAAGSAVPSLLPDGAQATDAAGGEAFPERPATDSQADTPPVGHADGDAGRSDNVELSDGNDPAAFAARKRRRKPYTDAEIEAAFTRFHRERGRWPLPSDAKTCAYLPHGAGSLRSTRFGSWQGVWDHFDAGKVPTGMGARNYRDAARDSSRERAASQPEPRGHARPGDGGGRDAQRPGTGARTLAATADGCGGAGQARPAPEPQPASAASPAAAATAPPSTLSHEDATTVSKLLRALADALDAGLFHQSNLAVLLDGLAVEVRRRLPETA
jgi:hypothetical protein